jgi:hypothetical protein
MDFFATPESEKSKASEEFGFGYSKVRDRDCRYRSDCVVCFFSLFYADKS